MSVDREARDQQRYADKMRARYGISYEQALRFAAKNDLRYPETVTELVRKKAREGKG